MMIAFIVVMVKLELNAMFLLSLLISLILQFAFVIYSGTKADIRRVTHGYDDCGYICGVDNEKRNDNDVKCSVSLNCIIL